MYTITSPIKTMVDSVHQVINNIKHMKKETKKVVKEKIVKTMKIGLLEGDFGSAKIDELVAKVNEIICFLNNQ